MKRLLIAMGTLLFIAAVLATYPRHGSGQDRTDERLSDLETRVALLEQLIEVPPSSPTPEVSYQIRGVLSVKGGFDLLRVGTLTCSGLGAFSDLNKGAVVTVKNEAGTTIGIGALDEGYPDPAVSDRACTFSFSVTVPKAEFYAIEVTHRGEVTFSFDDLEANQWFAYLQIGFGA